MLRFTTLALILATASTAQADTRFTASWYTDVTAEMHRNPSANQHSDNPDDCYEDVLAAKAAGDAPDTVVGAIKGKKVTLAEMGDLVCKPHQRAHHFTEVFQAIKKAHEANVWLTQIEMSSNHPENQAMLEKTAKECAAAADRGVQLGFGDLEFRDGIFIDQTKEKVCEPLAKAAKSFAADVENAANAALEEAKAPFKKAGIKGDKLHICASYADRTFRGKGGAELSPAQVKKSNLLFFWSGPDSSSGLYYLQRYAFKGDKLVGQSEVKLIRPPVAKDFR
jgi:hypothetical protein